MFIQTEATSDPGTVKFLPGKPVMPSGTAEFTDIDSSAASPLARRLFAIDGVARVALDADAITVAISDVENWQVLKPAILGAIMEHYVAGDAVIDGAGKEPGGNGADEEEDEISAQIRDLIDTRIRPAVAQNGGDVIYHGFEDGLVILEMVGGGWAARGGIENMLRHYVPEVTGIKDYLDASAKPGLSTPEAQAILQVLMNASIRRWPPTAGTLPSSTSRRTPSISASKAVARAAAWRTSPSSRASRWRSNGRCPRSPPCSIRPTMPAVPIPTMSRARAA